MCIRDRLARTLGTLAFAAEHAAKFFFRDEAGNGVVASRLRGNACRLWRNFDNRQYYGADTHVYALGSLSQIALAKNQYENR